VNRAGEHGAWILLTVILVCKLSDIGAYFVGSMLGHEVGELEFNIVPLLTSLVVALGGLGLGWLVYRNVPAGAEDPLKKPLGLIYTGMENKWFVDEGYWAVVVDRYVDVCEFLADYVDWRFWHDWFHDKVIAGTYNWLSNIALNRYADQRGIDAFFDGWGKLTKNLSASMRRVQNGFVRSYALSVLLGVVLILGYLLLK
jgi:NADH-quinone oxidoreductase subunit L